MYFTASGRPSSSGSSRGPIPDVQTSIPSMLRFLNPSRESILPAKQIPQFNPICLLHSIELAQIPQGGFLGADGWQASNSSDGILECARR